MDKLDSEQIASYQVMFEKYDTDKNGSIDIEELNEMLKSCGITMTQDELQDIIAEFDTDNNGSIDFEEFVQIFI